MAAAAILKNRKIAISPPWFDRFLQNLAQWRSSALVTVWSLTNLTSKEIQDGGSQHPNNLKITISRERFDRFGQHLAWWRILALRTRRAIHESSYASFLCVNFAYANSYVRNAIHKTLLRTKNRKNRKFVLKYTHDLSCRTTENFRKDRELIKLPQCLVLESQHKFVNGDACKM